MMNILLLLLPVLVIIPYPVISSTSNPNRDPTCLAIDSYHTYICTDNPEASRRAVASSFTDGLSPFDMDLGVEQRITGSETEQMRIRNVLRKMYPYFDEEVLTRSEYEHVRGRWSVHLYSVMFFSVKNAFLVWPQYNTNAACCAFFTAKTITSSVPSGHL